jgi:methyl-accepting chemotaxis protein
VAAAIRGITDASVKIKQLVDEVSTSSREQTLGIEHVAKAISHTENLTQRNAAGAEDSASAAA